MFRLLVEKELKNIIQSPKFVATFITCSVLIILSISVGISEYKNSVNQYNTAKNLNRQEMMQARSWRGLNVKTYRQPDPMTIFSSGVGNDIGRYSVVSSFQDVKMQHSVYSDDPIFAVFRFMDFTFIVTIVFSLFAILFTYNLINGEREGGTLRLVFSNSIPRSTFIGAKFIGSWLGLVIPLLIPILIGLLLVVISGVPLSGDYWLRISTLVFISVLYLTFFSAFGIFISSLTKYSTVSFLILLVSWIIFVFIIPRAGVLTASQFVKVPSIAEVESQNEAYSKSMWNKYFEQLEDIWKQRNASMQSMTEAEKQAYQDDNSYAWLEEEDKLRKDLEKNIADYSTRQNEDLRNKQAVMENLALTFSRLSPASSFQFAAMSLGGTGLDLKSRYQDRIREYKKNFLAYTDKKQKESGNQAGMFRISIDSESGIKINSGRDDGSLNISEVPKFSDPKYTLGQAFAPAIIDVGLLLVYSLLAYAGAFFFFLRYDLR